MSGYQLPSIPLEFSLTIPWETDLSQAVLEFRQDATFAGTAEGRLTSSMMVAGGIIMDFTSVPEPAPAVQAGLAAGLFVARRRTARRAHPAADGP